MEKIPQDKFNKKEEDNFDPETLALVEDLKLFGKDTENIELKERLLTKIRSRVKLLHADEFAKAFIEDGGYDEELCGMPAQIHGGFAGDSCRPTLNTDAESSDLMKYTITHECAEVLYLYVPGMHGIERGAHTQSIYEEYREAKKDGMLEMLQESKIAKIDKMNEMYKGEQQESMNRLFQEERDRRIKIYNEVISET